MLRVYQKFEALGEPLELTFTERDAAEAYANELRQEIAALPFVYYDTGEESSSDPEWNRLLWAAHEAPERERGIIVARAAVVIEEME